MREKEEERPYFRFSEVRSWVVASKNEVSSVKSV